MRFSDGGQTHLDLDFIGQEPLSPAAVTRVAELLGLGKLVVVMAAANAATEMSLAS